MSRIAVATPKSNADWDAKCDADTLVCAHEIMLDEKRYKAAKKWVSVQVVETVNKPKALTAVEGEMEKKK